MPDPATMTEPTPTRTHGLFRTLRVYSFAAQGFVDARDKGGDPPRGALLAWCAGCGAIGSRARLEGRPCEGPDRP